MATFHGNQSFQVTGLTKPVIKVSYFKAKANEISIYGKKTGMSGAEAKANGIYGVNGTFFQLDTTQVYGVAINNGSGVDANPFGTYGLTNNYDIDLDCFLFGTTSPVGGSSVFLSTGRKFPFNAGEHGTIVQGQAKWAIGGVNIRPYATYSSKTDFNNSLWPGFKSGYVITDSERTFMGVKGSDIYICRALDKCTVYDEHLILKSLGCTIGITLDGGGSSFISHKGGSVQDGNRKVPTIIRVHY